MARPLGSKVEKFTYYNSVIMLTFGKLYKKKFSNWIVYPVS